MESEQSESVVAQKRRALWPWVVSALVAIVFAVGLSFWWPMHRAGRVIELLNANESYYEANYHHPEWTKYLLDKKTFHPWFDDMEVIFELEVVATERFLDDLFQFRNLKGLWIRIDQSPLEKIRQFEALEVIYLQGEFSLWRDGLGYERELERHDVRHIRFSRDDWINLVTNLNAEEVAIVDFQVEGASVENSQIKILFLHRCEISGSFGESVSGLNALNRLSLSDSFITPGFWEQIQKHPTLVELSLSDCPIDGSTWKGLCGIENLQQLDVTIPWDQGLLPPESRPKRSEQNSGVVPTDTEAYELGPPIQPQGTYPTGDEWKPVANLRNLESLSFTNVLITKELTQALTALPRLRELSLNNFSFDEECLDHLASIPTLKYLALYNTKVTAAELKAFREKRPDVEIDHDIEGILSDRRAKQLINAGP